MKYRLKKLILIKSIILISIMVDYVECQHSFQKQDNTKTSNLASLNITKQLPKNQLSYFLNYQTGVYADFSNSNSVYGQLLLADTSNNDGCSKYLNKNLPNVYVSFVVKNNTSKCTYSDLINNAIRSNASALIVKTSAETESFIHGNNIQFESKISF